ncbi:oligosaccharide flippase family protein [Thomasclavelia sp.]|uniref:oligosaccharide flippase family protein n=1 Tax=Thomasclavelia sp. TaxID=3025757 RepID=UPI0025D6BB38|nr:oligosaccharide flippase family protein [Thomasclavelia sp.]
MVKSKYNTLVKNIGLFTIGSFGSKIVSFLMVPLYTAVLSTSDYGMVDLVSSTAQLLIPILILSIQDATLRFSMDSKYEKSDVISTTINIIIKGSIILIFGVFIVEIIGLFSLELSYYVFLILLFILGSLNNCFNLYLKAKNNASAIAISGILTTFITCVSNILLLIVFTFGTTGYMISNVIGLALSVLYQLFIGKIYKDLHLVNYNNLSKPMTKYSIPLISNSIAWWINYTSDRYILAYLCGVAANGIYSVAYKIPTILTTFQSIFYNAWSISAISEYDKNDKDGFISNNYTLYSCVSILVCSFLLIINVPLASVLYSGEYFIAWRSVPFLLVGTVFNGIAQFEGCLFAATKRTKMVSFTTVIGALVNMICNFIFIYFFGAIGAAFSTMLGYGVTWLLRTIFLQTFIKMKVNWSKHRIILCLIIIQAILATLNIFNFLQIIIFIVIVFMHKEYIQKIFNLVISHT